MTQISFFYIAIYLLGIYATFALLTWISNRRGRDDEFYLNGFVSIIWPITLANILLIIIPIYCIDDYYSKRQIEKYKSNSKPLEPPSPMSYGKELDAKLNDAAKKYYNGLGDDAYSLADVFYAGVNAERERAKQYGFNDPV